MGVTSGRITAKRSWGTCPAADSLRRVPGWSIPVTFLSYFCRTDANDSGGRRSKPLRRACAGRMLNALSGFAKVSMAGKSWGRDPRSPGLLREDWSFLPGAPMRELLNISNQATDSARSARLRKWTGRSRNCTAVSIGALAYGVAAGPTAFLSHSPSRQLPGEFNRGITAPFAMSLPTLKCAKVASWN